MEVQKTVFPYNMGFVSAKIGNLTKMAYQAKNEPNNKI